MSINFRILVALVVLSCHGISAVAITPIPRGGGQLRPIGDPVQAGNVVGRDLDQWPLGRIGHVGVWNGSNVVEVLNVSGQRNAIYVNTLDNFRLRTVYWGTAYPNIPNYTVYNCFETICIDYRLVPYGQVRAVSTRKAIAEYALMQYRLGADYTSLPTYSAAYPEDGYYPVRRGKYRCDTFVLSVFLSTTLGGNAIQSRYAGYAIPDQTWYGRLDSMLNSMRSGTMTPASLFAAVSRWV